MGPRVVVTVVKTRLVVIAAAESLDPVGRPSLVRVVSCTISGAGRVYVDGGTKTTVIVVVVVVDSAMSPFQGVLRHHLLIDCKIIDGRTTVSFLTEINSREGREKILT